MTSRAEDCLYLSLTDVDALERIATRGIDEEMIPTVAMRPVVTWAVDQYFASGMRQAPSRVALRDTWGEVIDDARVELLPEDEEADTVDWALDELTSAFIHWKFQTFAREAATAMATAASVDRVKTLQAITNELFEISTSATPQRSRTDLATGARKALDVYRTDAMTGHFARGMMFGLDLVDQHTYGIHSGELAILAAGPKTGKSFMLAHVALQEFQAGRKVLLVTLENSVEMTMQRFVSLACGVNGRDWQRGTCTPEEVLRVEEWMQRLQNPLPTDGSVEVIMPEPGKRTVQSIVRYAQMVGAETLIVDQLTFMEHPSPGRKPRHEIVGEIMHDLKSAISTGPWPMACLLAHQINRPGVEAARKNGYLLMDHLAESAETERTVDWAFGLYQSREQKRIGAAVLQVLAARREDENAWEMAWEPHRGLVAAVREIELEED